MLKQPWLSFSLSGVSLTEFGLEIPSPIVSLTLNNSEISSMTSWTLIVNVGGDDRRKINIAAFEALLYSAKMQVHIRKHLVFQYPSASDGLINMVT